MDTAPKHPETEDRETGGHPVAGCWSPWTDRGPPVGIRRKGAARCGGPVGADQGVPDVPAWAGPSA